MTRRPGTAAGPPARGRPDHQHRDRPGRRHPCPQGAVRRRVRRDHGGHRRRRARIPARRTVRPSDRHGGLPAHSIPVGRADPTRGPDPDPWADPYFEGGLVALTVGDDGAASGGIVGKSWFMWLRQQRVPRDPVGDIVCPEEERAELPTMWTDLHPHRVVGDYAAQLGKPDPYNPGRRRERVPSAAVRPPATLRRDRSGAPLVGRCRQPRRRPLEVYRHARRATGGAAVGHDAQRSGRLVLQGYIEGKRLVAGDVELASTQVKEGRPYIWPCSTRGSRTRNGLRDIQSGEALMNTPVAW